MRLIKQLFINSAIISSVLFLTTEVWALQQWVLTSTGGEIIQVETKPAKYPAIDPWTEVTVHATLACYQVWENFSFMTLSSKDGTIDILASIVVSEPANRSSLSCVGTRVVEKNLHIDGIYSLGEVRIRFLPLTPMDSYGRSFIMPNGTAAVIPINDVKIKKIEALCASGSPCTDGGTIITLSTTMPCVNSLAGLAYETEQHGQDLFVYLYGAEYQSGNDALCTDVNITFQITALMQTALSQKNVKVILLK